MCVTIAARDDTLAGDPELRALVAGAFGDPAPAAPGPDHVSDDSATAHGDPDDVSLVSQGSHVRIPDSELAEMLPPLARWGARPGQLPRRERRPVARRGAGARCGARYRH